MNKEDYTMHPLYSINHEFTHQPKTIFGEMVKNWRGTDDYGFIHCSSDEDNIYFDKVSSNNYVGGLLNFENIVSFKLGKSDRTGSG